MLETYAPESSATAPELQEYESRAPDWRIHMRLPPRSNRATNASSKPDMVCPGNAPWVEPVTKIPAALTVKVRGQLPPSNSLSGVPTCVLHSRVPAWSYLKTRTSVSKNDASTVSVP